MSRSSHSSNLCCRRGEEGMEGGGRRREEGMEGGGKREGQWRGGREKGGGKEKEEESRKGECYREYHYSRLLSNSRATPTNYNGYTSMVSLYLENPSHSGS